MEILFSVFHHSKTTTSSVMKQSPRLRRGIHTFLPENLVAKVDYFVRKTNNNEGVGVN